MAERRRVWGWPWGRQEARRVHLQPVDPVPPIVPPHPYFGAVELRFNTAQGFYYDPSMQAGWRSFLAQFPSEARSLELLRSFLDAEQKASFDRECGFEVRTAYGNRYRIGYGSVAYVRPSGARFGFCIYAPGLPECDNMLAKKLLLETNERLFLQTARPQVDGPAALERTARLWYGEQA